MSWATSFSCLATTHRRRVRRSWLHSTGSRTPILLIVGMAEKSFRAQVPMPLEAVALSGEHGFFIFHPCGAAAQEIFLCSCASGCATSG